jgi:hypothetical protein
LVRKAKSSARVVDLMAAKSAYDAEAVFVDVREISKWARTTSRMLCIFHDIPRGLLEFQVQREPHLHDKLRPVVT